VSCEGFVAMVVIERRCDSQGGANRAGKYDSLLAKCG